MADRCRVAPAKQGIRGSSTMFKKGFDNDKYLKMQSEHIRERISKFGGKLYLEFGGKLFDDYHASRVLPGFQPDSKIRMLRELKDDAEVVIVINAGDMVAGQRNKLNYRKMWIGFHSSLYHTKRCCR